MKRNQGRVRAEGATNDETNDVKAGAEEMVLADAGHPRVITVAGRIDSDAVERVADHLAGLNHESLEPIAVQFSSPGGSLQDGWALHDLFSTNASPIITVGFGYVGSAATIAFQAGVLRLLSPNAKLMIHQVGMSVEDASFDVSDMRKQLKEMERLQRDIERLFARRTGNSLKAIRAWCGEEKEFTARNAVTNGFADKVLRARRPPAPKKRRR